MSNHKKNNIKNILLLNLVVGVHNIINFSNDFKGSILLLE